MRFMNKTLPLLGVLALALLVLAGGMTGIATAKTLTIVQGTDIESLDVHVVTSSPSYAVLDHIYETLFTISPEGEIEPLLAESFTVEPDGRTYTVELREGVTFTDGTPFDAEAVKANFDRVLDPEGTAAYRSLIEPIVEMTVVDSHTLQLRSEEPFGPVLVHLAHSGLGMISPRAIEQGNDYMAANPVGTGPFVLDEWRQGESIVLSRKADYWGQQANLDELVFKVVLDDGARLIELEAGTADVAIRVPPSEAERLEMDPNINVDRTPGLRTIFIYFNVQEHPFDDVRVRQAFNYAVDNQAIVDALLLGAALASDAPMASPVFGYAAQSPYSRDLSRARSLLDEAGFDFDQTVVLHHPSGRYVQDALIADAVRSNLRQLGVNVELRTMEWTAYLDFIRKPEGENEVQMALLGWGVATMDADYALYSLFHSSLWPPSFNLGFYKNDEVDALLERGRSTADVDERLRIYADAQSLIWGDAPWLFLHNEVQLTGIRANVDGFVVHPTERYLAHTADKE